MKIVSIKVSLELDFMHTTSTTYLLEPDDSSLIQEKRHSSHSLGYVFEFSKRSQQLEKGGIEDDYSSIEEVKLLIGVFFGNRPSWWILDKEKVHFLSALRFVTATSR